MQLPQFSLVLIPILALLPYVAAHGLLLKISIDGTTYNGPLPADAAGGSAIASPIRQIADIGPVKGATNPDMNCGLSAKLASMVVPANPGSVMEFYWGGATGGKWPHVAGPILTYMASCGTTTCDKFNGSTAQWFKIDELGKKPDGNTWYQAEVANGTPVSLTLPTQVASGQYLVRHEIIGLQNAGSQGGAEFYPSCSQINVGGSQTGTPNQTVSFPGAYSDTDPGILDPDVYNPGSSYIFPGPPVSNLASPSDMSTSNGGQDNGNQSSPASLYDTTNTNYQTTGTSTTSGYGAQPTPPTVQPTDSSVQPSDSSVQPTDSYAQPTDTYAQPTDSSVQPTDSSMQPTDSYAQPTDSYAQPTGSHVRPTRSNVQPTDSNMQPTDSYAQPTGSHVRPTRSNVQPTDSYAQPTDSYVPTESNAQPMQSSAHSVHSGAHSVHSGAHSMRSSGQPMQPSVQPTQPSIQPTQSGAQPTETSSSTCASQRRRDATLARRSTLAQHKRRTNYMRALRNPAHHS